MSYNNCSNCYLVCYLHGKIGKVLNWVRGMDSA